MNITEIPKMGQGPARETDEDDIKRDELGFTHPNLHRRIYTQPDCTANHKYSIGIYGYNSYRTTEIITHDEESTDSEIP